MEGIVGNIVFIRTDASDEAFCRVVMLSSIESVTLRRIMVLLVGLARGVLAIDVSSTCDILLLC